MGGAVGRIKVGSISHAYVQSGKGEPLVLLHGGESSLSQYDLFRPLLGPGIKAIAYDQRGVGASEDGSDPYTIATLAQDCAGLIEALGYDRAHLMGASLGGAIAMHVALDHPERVASLTLISAPSSLSDNASAAQKVIAMSPPERARFMLDAVISPDGQRRDPGLVEQVRSVLQRSAMSSARQAAIRTLDCTDRLAEITAPTLVINGTDDPLVPVATAELLAERIPAAALELIEGGRHGLTLEQRDVTAGLVRRFVLEQAASDHRTATRSVGPAADKEISPDI
jgi:pimeloyl-ACP methyl ester carboxylesterase